jgi:phosphohistidine phosphatase
MVHSVYFSQHGLAVDKADDAERPLSRAGIQQTKSIARILHDSKTPVTSIFHSGKLRAAQTAKIFASAMDISTTSETDGLSPNDDVTLLAQSLNINNALYIGHLPHLEKLVTYLITGSENVSIINFQNSAVACLEKYETQYQLQWYITPGLINSGY